MATYEDPNAPAEVWRITGEHRTRKELRNIPGGTQRNDPRLAPTTDRAKYPRN